MMKSLLILILTAVPLLAEAVTTLRFLPLNKNALALVLSRDSYGNTDSDFEKLYALLNVPEQDSPMGKGKGLKSADKGFTLTCGLQRAQCQVVLNQSGDTVINPNQQYMSYRATGEQADFLSSAFFKESSGEVSYITSDRLFRIRGTSDEFFFEASQSGF